MDKKLYLEDLPRWRHGAFNGGIDWDAAIEYDVRFEYDGIYGSVKIIDVDRENRKIGFEYNGKYFKMDSSSFVKCSFAEVVGRISRKHIYDIGKVVNGLKIIDKIYVSHNSQKNKKGYLVTCIVDGYTYEVTEGGLKAGRGCVVCSNKLVVKGINDIATTAPQLLKYLMNIEDAYVNICTSTKRVNARCPYCDEAYKGVAILSLYNGSFSCKKCSDGVSYPNKFMFSLIKQIIDDVETEKSFAWSDNKRYDLYLDELNCIIENHGGQHYEDTQLGRSLEEEQENDRYKEKLAKENGIGSYIVIDCRKSQLNWIKNSVMNSELPRLLNFKENDIDWLECDMFANKNLLREFYKIISKTDFSQHSMQSTARKLGISDSMAKTFFNKLIALKWIIIDNTIDINSSMVSDNIKIHSKPKRKTMPTRKKVIGIEVIKDDIFLGMFDSILYIAINSKELFGVKLDKYRIRAVLIGVNKSYEGFQFRYAYE